MEIKTLDNPNDSSQTLFVMLSKEETMAVRKELIGTRQGGKPRVLQVVIAAPSENGGYKHVGSMTPNSTQYK